MGMLVRLVMQAVVVVRPIVVPTMVSLVQRMILTRMLNGCLHLGPLSPLLFVHEVSASWGMKRALLQRVALSMFTVQIQMRSLGMKGGSPGREVVEV